MATGQKISAQTVATSFDSTDLATIVQSGVNKSVTHDVLMDDTQICKVWVNFNGTGVVAIRDDFNVSSITDNGTGDYTINFTNALTDANYSVSFGFSGSVNVYMQIDAASAGSAPTTKTTTALQVTTKTPANVNSDVADVSIQVFGS